MIRFLVVSGASPLIGLWCVFAAIASEVFGILILLLPIVSVMLIGVTIIEDYIMQYREQPSEKE